MTFLNQAKGFGSSPSSKEKQSKNKNNSSPYKKIYSAPALYDLAVGYRNYEEEVEFLLEAHKQFSGAKERPKNIIEIASGPARHSISALNSNSIQKATALDLAPEMVEYGTEVATNELKDDNLSQFKFVCDDMRTFTVDDGPYDSAWILLGSLQHLTTNQDVISCFFAVHRALAPKGSLILELPHPNELFQMIDSTKNSWEVPLEDENGSEYGELQVTWGDDGDEFDAITQIRQNTVVLELKGVENAESQNVRDIVPLRLFTAQEMELLAQCGGFEVAALYGALSDEVDVTDEDIAYRLVCVLRKV